MSNTPAVTPSVSAAAPRELPPVAEYSYRVIELLRDKITKTGNFSDAEYAAYKAACRCVEICCTTYV